MTTGGQVVEQPAEAEQIVGARFVAQRRILFAQPAEPADDVWVPSELGEAVDPRKGGMEVVQETAGDASVIADGVASQGKGQRLDVRFKYLAETGFGLAHAMCAEARRVRLATARVYSRQTSWGASWT